jgi:Na+-driven multidrug efflux pump
MSNPCRKITAVSLVAGTSFFVALSTMVLILVFLCSLSINKFNRSNKGNLNPDAKKYTRIARINMTTPMSSTIANSIPLTHNFFQY